MTKRFFNFPETYIYILYIKYIPLIKNEEECAGQLSYVNIRDKLKGCTKKKFRMGIWIFGILCTNVLELTGGYGAQILQVFTLFFIKGFLFEN